MTETMSSNPCRICMGSKMNQTSIFINDLSRKVTEIADVEVQEGDGLPPTICEDCELDLEKCFKFREQIQWADSKFRESLSVSEVVFEECQIKQEVGPMHTFMNDDNQDQIEDDDDDRGPSDNDEDYEMREDPEDKTENAEKEGNQVTHPLDHVEIIEHRTKQEIHIASTDQNSQEEPLIVAQNMKSENEPTSDPLMHTEPQSMETDNNVPGPSTSASTVFGRENLHPYQWIPIIGEENSIKPRIRLENVFSGGIVDIRTLVPQGNHMKHFFVTENLKSSGSGTCTGIRAASFFNQGILPQNQYFPRTSNEQPSIRIIGASGLDIGRNKITNTNYLETRDRLFEPECIVNADKNTKQTNPPPNKGKKSRKSEFINEEDKKQFKVHSDTHCFVCDITFIGNNSLLEHLEEKKVFCRICTCEFEDHSSLEHHFTSHRGQRCLTCNEIFFCKSDVFQHFKKNPVCDKRKPRFKCEICDVTVAKMKQLERHKLLVHTAGEGRFECIVCKKEYDREFKLEVHLNTVHVAFENIPCKICGKLYLGQKALKSHMQQTHLEKMKNRSFVCSICGKVFSKESALKKRVDTHDQTGVLCELCGETVVGGRKGMYQHKSKKHSNKVFTCEWCSEQFDCGERLRSHKRKHMSNQETPAYCEICGKKYKNSRVLKLHMNIHSDERNYKCEVCGATFKQKVTLSTHSRVHQDNLRYACENCGQTFRWKQTFQKHIDKCKGSPGS